MYQNQLLEAYKKAQNYVQDKQIAMDMDIPAQRISDFRKGRRYLTDSQAVFLAEQSGIDSELALLGCHADRNDNPSIKAVWESIAKKWNSQGLQLLSVGLTTMTASSLAAKESLSQYALCGQIYGECLSVSTVAPALAEALRLIYP